MDYSEMNTVIDFTTNVKASSLYFENVIPLNPIFISAYPDEKDHTEMLVLMQKKLLPAQLSGDRQMSAYMIYVMAMITSAKVESSTPPPGMQDSLIYTDDYMGKAKIVLDDFFSPANQYRQSPIILEQEPTETTKKDAPMNPFILLSNMPLVDVTNVEWRQIMEFREDAESKKKLRRLRLFLYEEYLDKDPQYVKDDILRRVDEYNDVISEWGFETKLGIMSMILSSKTLIASFGAAAGAALWNNPDLLASSIVTGVSIELGKIAFELKKRHFKLEGLKGDNPLAYVFDMQSKLDDL